MNYSTQAGLLTYGSLPAPPSQNRIIPVAFWSRLSEYSGGTVPDSHRLPFFHTFTHEPMNLIIFNFLIDDTLSYEALSIPIDTLLTHSILSFI
jgi:hypothetical protein